MIPQLGDDIYWTDDVVIELYYDHKTMEQFHSELKMDMDVERFSSSKFASNDLVLAISVFVYSLECMIGQDPLQIEEVFSRSRCAGGVFVPFPLVLSAYRGSSCCMLET